MRAVLPRTHARTAPHCKRIAGSMVEELHESPHARESWPLGTEVGNGIEDQGKGGIEDRLVVVTIELAATEATAGARRLAA